MDSRITRLPTAVLSLALAGAPQVGAQAVRSAQWKSTVRTESTPPGQALQEAEIWLAGGRMRIEERGKGSEKTVVLKTEDGVYVWVEGQSAGTKMSVGLAQRSGRPSHEYVRRIEEIRSRGKRIGGERVAGYACEVFEYESPRDGKGIYWLATKLQNFPVKAIVERPVSLPYRSAANLVVKLEYHNTDVRIPGSDSGAKLAVPAGVQFQEVTELMLRGRAPRP